LLTKVESEENKALRLAIIGMTKYERALTTYRNDNWEPPLVAALEAKDEESAEALLDGEADPNEVDGRGRNALYMAACEGCRLPLFRRILGMIHNVNAGSNKWERTPLMWAAANDHLDMVVSLMNHPRIDVNVRDCDKETALHWAVFFNKPAIVAQLVSDDRVDTSLKGKYHRTPLKMAIDERHHECVKILRKHGAPEY
jgi:ankyrin repeat protein